MTVAPNDSGDKWPLNTGSDYVDALTVVFDKNSSLIERQMERAVLAIKMDNSADPEHYEWRFALGGLQYASGHADYRHDIESQVSADGKLLTLIINCTEDRAVPGAEEYVDFCFTALRKSKKNGECQIFESKDPSIGIGPIRPS